MNDNNNKTKKQLLNERIELRQRVSELEVLETRRKRTEKALRETEVGYKEIFDSATDAFLIFDLNGNIVEANPAAYKMHGYSHEEIIGLTGKDIVNADDYYDFEQFLRDTKTKGEFQVESVDVRKDGTPFIIEVKGTEFNYKGKKHLLAILRDITERKRIEVALRESERKLRILSSNLLSILENEKKGIALELHDSIGQTLTAIKFGVENTLQETNQNDPVSAAESLKDIIPVIQSAIEDVRKVTMDLRPTILDNLGIVSTISWCCQEFQKIYSNICIREEMTIAEDEIPQTLKITIYRILQEALNNIAKHSQADIVNLSLAKREQTIELIIKDNGRGFDLEKTSFIDSSGRGFGLISMSERAKLAGGSFYIESVRGEGTTLRATWPVELT